MPKNKRKWVVFSEEGLIDDFSDVDIDKFVADVTYMLKNNIEMSKSIFLIEKGWIDPMENRNADGYEPFGYKESEKEAIEFCEDKGFWTVDDCWSIMFYKDNKMPKYKYKEIKLI